MLQKKINSTISLIEDVVYNKNIATEHENLARINSSFFDSLDRLTPTIQSYILAKKNFNFVITDFSNSKMRELISYSKETFNNSKAVKPDAFRKKVDSFIEEISLEWVTYFKNDNHELLSGLNIMVPVHSTPIVIKNCINTLRKCEKWPLNQEMINDYLLEKQKAEKLLKEMHFDDDIKEFLKKVTSRTATIADLTPQILDWIRFEDISYKIALTIKGL